MHIDDNNFCTFVFQRRYSMVRTYKRNSTQGSYGSDRLALAVAAVREGQSIRGAGADYGIPRRTLKRHCIGDVRIPGAVTLGRKRCIYSSAFEAQLVDYAKEMSERMYGLTTTDVRRLAFTISKKLGVTNNFDKVRGLAGKDWLSNFMRRHPSLSIRAPIATSIARVEGFNRDAVMEFFRLYKGILQTGEYSATRIWNCDETGFTTVSKPGKVICKTGTRQVRKVSSGERGKNITALCCMSAAGAFIPPLFVFPRKRMVNVLMNGAPAGAIGGSGYIDSITFMTWLKHFAAIADCTKDDPHILLLDGHESHKTLEAIDFAREHGIILLTFPPHCTHRLQPLDRTYFKSLKSAFSRSCDNWLISNKGRAITQYDVMPLFEQAYSSTATVQSAVNGFAVCGLWPFNDSKFDAEFNVLEMSTLQPVSAHQVITAQNTPPHAASRQVTSAQVTNSHSIIAHVTAAEVITTHVTAPQIVTSHVPFSDVGTSRISVLPVSSNDVADVESAVPEVLTMQVNTPPIRLGSSEPTDIRAIIVQCSPPTQKRTNKSRKSKSAILTSSPYKRLAQEKRQNKKKDKTAKNVSKSKPPP